MMTSPVKPWESAPKLQNSTQLRNHTSANLRDLAAPRSAPVLPPLPRSAPMAAYSSYMPPYSTGYNSLGYGGYNSYSSYGMPYRSSMYSSYGGYGGMYGVGSYQDDAERRFVQYAEESSRNTFANVESIVRAVNSISMMLDNTFFAMTSSFRAVLSVAENFGRLRSMFGHIWYSISLFRLFSWLHRKFLWLTGRQAPRSAAAAAWRQAAEGASPAGPAPGSSWPTLAFLGVLVSAPYIISKFLPKYEDKTDPVNWKTPGARTKAAFDFVARSASELSVQTNDEVTLAPTYIQEEMNLKNTGWAFALCNGRSGVVPLNHLVLDKSPIRTNPPTGSDKEILVPRENTGATHKTHTKRVSFGENQIFENVDLEDYVKPEGGGSSRGEESELGKDREVENVETKSPEAN